MFIISEETDEMLFSLPVRKYRYRTIEVTTTSALALPSDKI